MISFSFVFVFRENPWFSTYGLDKFQWFLSNGELKILIAAFKEERSGKRTSERINSTIPEMTDLVVDSFREYLKLVRQKEILEYFLGKDSDNLNATDFWNFVKATPAKSTSGKATSTKPTPTTKPKSSKERSTKATTADPTSQEKNPPYWNLPFRIKNPGIIGESMVTKWRKGKPGYLEFFQTPSTPFYLPGTNYGADIAFVLEFLKGDGSVAYTIPAFLQAKFTPSADQNRKKINDAILKTDPIILQRVKDLDKKGRLVLDVSVSAKDDNVNTVKTVVTEVENRLNLPPFEYGTYGSIRFIFRVSQGSQLVPPAFIDETSDPPSLVIFCEKEHLLECFGRPGNRDDALKILLEHTSGMLSFFSFFFFSTPSNHSVTYFLLLF